MSEILRPNFEQASRCPKCDQPGEDRRVMKSPTKRGAQIHYIYCQTKLCRWYNTCWMVQVNEDGSIPPPTDHSGEKKVYEGFEGHDERAAELIEMLKRNAQQEMKPGGAEIG